jgi:Domain of unknown function (DUF4398)
MSWRTVRLSGAGVLVCAAAAGCATQGAKPNDELTKAHTVIEQAEKGGNAQRYAAADLQRAHDELADAERLSGQGKYAEARYFAQRAEADADVAVARGNAAEQQKAAADVAQASNTLRQESQRNESAGPRN